MPCAAIFSALSPHYMFIFQKDTHEDGWEICMSFSHGCMSWRALCVCSALRSHILGAVAALHVHLLEGHAQGGLGGHGWRAAVHHRGGGHVCRSGPLLPASCAGEYCVPLYHLHFAACVPATSIGLFPALTALRPLFRVENCLRSAELWCTKHSDWCKAGLSTCHCS